MSNERQPKDLVEFLKTQKPLVIAEGYLFEFLRRGRVRAGSLVPEVVLDCPEAVRAMHQEFVDAGSDVVQAFTYYAHRQKMKDVGRENELEGINKRALEIARSVAIENDKFFAGGLCNSNLWDPDDQSTVEACEQMFSEQCQWAKDAGVDYMIAETFWDYGEASLALKILKKFGFTTVISICPVNPRGMTFDGLPIPEALRRLQEEGADVVSLNCSRGPATMMPLIEECRKVCKGPLGCLPICYRTDAQTPNFQSLKHLGSDKSCYPHDLIQHSCAYEDIRQYAQKCKEIGVDYVGLCCGNDPTYMRTLAKCFDRKTALDKYGTDRGKNVVVGDYEGDDSTSGVKVNRYARLASFALE
ncbi:betaine--homocysteine S-methyltransferase 1-like [Watersipora subatra]|uniref:betaine--homocysteine S-methyltransferase 1-like n=1 Tax=Watersipora subatra TaxID=2589382 RepID=UPI00355BD36D